MAPSAHSPSVGYTGCTGDGPRHQRVLIQRHIVCGLLSAPDLWWRRSSQQRRELAVVRTAQACRLTVIARGMAALLPAHVFLEAEDGSRAVPTLQASITHGPTPPCHVLWPARNMPLSAFLASLAILFCAPCRGMSVPMGGGAVDLAATAAAAAEHERRAVPADAPHSDPHSYLVGAQPTAVAVSLLIGEHSRWLCFAG